VTIEKCIVALEPSDVLNGKYLYKNLKKMNFSSREAFCARNINTVYMVVAAGLQNLTQENLVCEL
jgi:hypothetical protein